MLTAESATALADALQRDLDNGNVAAYAAAYEARIAALPLSECTLCSGTGIRTDAIGRQYGFDIPHDPATGRGGCNGCEGNGKVQSWEAHYPFSVENVAEYRRLRPRQRRLRDPLTCDGRHSTGRAARPRRRARRHGAPGTATSCSRECAARRSVEVPTR